MSCLLFLLDELFLSTLLLLYLIENCAYCEIDLPKHSLEKIGHDSDDHKVHQNEESDDESVVPLAAKGVTPGIDCPTTLS